MISLTSHVLMLYMTNFIEWRGKVYNEDILTVSLNDPPEKKEKDKEVKKETKPFHQLEHNANIHSGLTLMPYVPSYRTMSSKNE